MMKPIAKARAARSRALGKMLLHSKRLQHRAEAWGALQQLYKQSRMWGFIGMKPAVDERRKAHKALRQAARDFTTAEDAYNKTCSLVQEMEQAQKSRR